MQLKQAIKNVLPASIFHVLRDLPWKLRGLVARAPSGKGPIPPLHLMFDGPRNYELFLKMGQETLGFYQRVANMRPNDCVLDIGCGVGRRTLPLLNYLTNEALYVGMEIDRRGVDWLTRNVTSKHPRFVFLHLDIANKFYNPHGALQASRLVLPFPNESFDHVVLWSVFTHMYPRDIAHYLAEIARVLKPAGSLIASYYLYNDEILTRPGALEYFAYPLNGCRTSNPNNAEDAIAVEDRWLQETLLKVGLEVASMRYGGWSGHQLPEDMQMTNLQDIVIAKKPGAAR